jgi:predicted CXXCH cytochrome family protein
MISRNPLLVCLVSLLTTIPAAGQDPAEPPRQKRTPVLTEQGTVTCLRCHSGELMRAVQAGAHFTHSYASEVVATHLCESCHGPGSIHVSRAHGGKGFPPLIRFGRGADSDPRERQLAACLACHGSGQSGAVVVNFIGSSHDRSAINCSTCHAAHTESDPMRQREQQASTCIRCHRSKMAKHPLIDGNAVEFDPAPCSACHDVHAANPVKRR